MAEVRVLLQRALENLDSERLLAYYDSYLTGEYCFTVRELRNRLKDDNLLVPPFLKSELMALIEVEVTIDDRINKLAHTPRVPVFTLDLFNIDACNTESVPYMPEKITSQFHFGEGLNLSARGPSVGHRFSSHRSTQQILAPNPLKLSNGTERQADRSCSNIIYTGEYRGTCGYGTPPRTSIALETCCDIPPERKSPLLHITGRRSQSSPKGNTQFQNEHSSDNRPKLPDTWNDESMPILAGPGIVTAPRRRGKKKRSKSKSTALFMDLYDRDSTNTISPSMPRTCPSLSIAESDEWSKHVVLSRQEESADEEVQLCENSTSERLDGRGGIYVDDMQEEDRSTRPPDTSPSVEMAECDARGSISTSPIPDGTEHSSDVNIADDHAEDIDRYEIDLSVAPAPADMWEIYLSEEGYPYHYNPCTGDSTWLCPLGRYTSPVGTHVDTAESEYMECECIADYFACGGAEHEQVNADANSEATIEYNYANRSPTGHTVDGDSDSVGQQRPHSGEVPPSASPVTSDGSVDIARAVTTYSIAFDESMTPEIITHCTSVQLDTLGAEFDSALTVDSVPESDGSLIWSDPVLYDEEKVLLYIAQHDAARTTMCEKLSPSDDVEAAAGTSQVCNTDRRDRKQKMTAEERTTLSVTSKTFSLDLYAGDGAHDDSRAVGLTADTVLEIRTRGAQADRSEIEDIKINDICSPHRGGFVAGTEEHTDCCTNGPRKNKSEQRRPLGSVKDLPFVYKTVKANLHPPRIASIPGENDTSPEKGNHHPIMKGRSLYDTHSRTPSLVEEEIDDRKCSEQSDPVWKCEEGARIEVSPPCHSPIDTHFDLSASRSPQSTRSISKSLPLEETERLSASMLLAKQRAYVEAKRKVTTTVSATTRIVFNDWVIHITDEGYPYHYNTVTGDSAWECPLGLFLSPSCVDEVGNDFRVCECLEKFRQRVNHLDEHQTNVSSLSADSYEGEEDLKKIEQQYLSDMSFPRTPNREYAPGDVVPMTSSTALRNEEDQSGFVALQSPSRSTRIRKKAKAAFTSALSFMKKKKVAELYI